MTHEADDQPGMLLAERGGVQREKHRVRAQQGERGAEQGLETGGFGQGLLAQSLEALLPSVRLGECPQGEPDAHLGLGEGAQCESGEDEAAEGALVVGWEMRHPLCHELLDEVSLFQIDFCALWALVSHSVQKIPHNALF